MDFNRLQNVIQKLCDNRGIKPRTAYEESGVGRSFYDNIRKGSVPSVEKLQALAVYFMFRWTTSSGTPMFRRSTVRRKLPQWKSPA